MNKIYRRTTLAALISIAVASAAQAQEQPGSGELLEEVIVTATKREESIYEVPIAVSAFTEDVIFKQGIVDLTDIGKFVPNMTVTGFSAGHVSSVNVFIRGIGIQDHLITTEPGVGVYVDGVYFGRQVGQNWSLANIERVEVLRGPQGTLYGRNTIGGAINIITRKPDDQQGGRFTANAGTRGRLGGDFYWNQPLTDNFAVSLTGGYTQRDGVGDFLNHAAAKEVGELDEWNVRFQANWDVTDNFSVLFAYDKNDGDGGLRPYTTGIDEVPSGLLYLTGARNSDVSADPYDNAGGFEYDANGNIVDRSIVTNSADGWSVTADWEISDAFSTRLIYSDRSSDYLSGLDDDSVGGIANPDLDFILGGTDADNVLGGVIFQYPETGFADQDSTELQLFGDFDGWDFVMGLYRFDEKGGNHQENYFLGFPGTFINYQETESKAIYGNVGFDLSETVRMTLGARYTEDEKYATTEPIVGVLSFVGQRDWDETSWEASLSWDLNNDMNLYGTIQNGYQSGQFPARAYCFTGLPDCYLAGDNVTATNYEIGLKGQPTDTLSMSAAIFFTDYSDLPYQVSDQASGGGFNTVNLIVDQESFGLEWESLWAPTDNFTLHAAIGYIDVDVKDPNPNVAAPLTPEWTGSLSPEFTQSLGNGGSIVWHFDVSYRDDMYGQPYSNVPLTNIDSRTLVNFDIAYHEPNDRWLLGLYGRNVFDEKYDNARLLPTDYLLIILNNDRSEFGLRFMYTFGL